MNTPTWFLNELTHAGPEHLDVHYVPHYDDKAGTDPTEDVVILGNLGLDATHTLVDLGAGTGTFVLAAAPHCRRVVAVDISQAMLAGLRDKAARHGVANIECVQQGFLSYVHHGDPADFVYSRHALHHLPDFWKALALHRIAAMMPIGGVFYLRDLVFSCDLQDINQVVDAWLARASTRADQGWTRPELETHLRDEYSTFAWVLEPMLERAGFEIQHTEHDPSCVRSAYTCIKRR